MRTMAWKPTRFRPRWSGYRPGPGDNVPVEAEDELALLIAEHCACYPDEERRQWMEKALLRWARVRE
jgi:hypothetical protein